MIKENPILFGCLAVLGLLSLLACSGMAAMYFLADEIVEKGMEKLEQVSAEAGKQAGIKSPMTSVPELMKSGWSLSINADSNSNTVTFGLQSMEPREVDCAVLQGVLFPYLAGTKEVVVITSDSRTVSENGTVVVTPVECRWTGFPGSGGALDKPLADDDDSAIR